MLTYPNGCIMSQIYTYILRLIHPRPRVLLSKKITQILSDIEISTIYNIWQNKLHCHLFWGFFFIDKSVSQDIPYSQQKRVNTKSNNVLKFNTLCTLATNCTKYRHLPLRSMSTFEHHRWNIGILEHWNIGILVAAKINSDTHVHIGTPTSWFKLKGKLNVYELSNSIHGAFNWHTFKCPQKHTIYILYISLFNSKPYLKKKEL